MSRRHLSTEARREAARKAQETRRQLGPRYPLTDAPKVGVQRYAALGASTGRVVTRPTGPNHPTRDSQ